MIACRQNWNPGFFETSSLFDPIAPLARKLAASHPRDWPDLHDYQALLDSTRGIVSTESGAVCQFVNQGARPGRFEQRYEPRIFLSGEIQTRLRNWHDFFQVLVWCLFPATKLRLNKLHFEAAGRRYHAASEQPNRSSVENAVTLFDECGAVVLSSSPTLLELVRDHDWKRLFWERRAELSRHLHCCLFGHALYEKSLRPYPGLTAHALLVPAATDFHEWAHEKRIAFIDRTMAGIFSRPHEDITTAMFSPFPLLGMPGSCAENGNESYYDNTDYFRPRRVAGGES